jgi:hypothetical protein
VEEKGRDFRYNGVLDIGVEWLCSLSGGVLRFAPFLTCKLAELEPSLWGIAMGNAHGYPVNANVPWVAN